MRRTTEKCGNCDICINPPETFDATEDARKALSCVYRLNQRFGAAYVIEVLRGHNTERISRLHHDKLSTYGIGNHFQKQEWHSIFRQLIHQGYIEQDIANYSVLKLTEKSRPLLRGEQQLILAKPRIKTTKAVKKAKKAKLPSSTIDYDKALFEELRQLRKRIANDAKVPPFIVFSDVSLIEMAAFLPKTAAEFLSINGVGQVKLDRYGEAFLQLIQSHCSTVSEA